MTRCIDLNNPMKIEKNSTAWKGEAMMQDDPTLIRFETPEMGLRAGMKILLTYQRKDDLEHIAAFVTRYASLAENNAMINAVSARCGVGPTEYFDIEIPDNLIRLAQAIVRHEQGVGPDSAFPFWFAETVYEAAARDALA